MQFTIGSQCYLSTSPVQISNLVEVHSTFPLQLCSVEHVHIIRGLQNVTIAFKRAMFQTQNRACKPDELDAFLSNGLVGRASLYHTCI
jgi:hypothetical protein